MSGRDLRIVLAAAAATAMLLVIFLAYRGPGLALALDVWSLCL